MKIDQYYVDLAVDVLQSQNPAFIQALKDFLTVLPNPSLVEKTLSEGVYRLIESNPEAANWVVQNSCYLTPELDLHQLGVSLIHQRLQEQGLTPSEDFVIQREYSDSPEYQVFLTPQAEVKLLQNTSPSEKFLIFKLFNIQPKP